MNISEFSDYFESLPMEERHAAAKVGCVSRARHRDTETVSDREADTEHRCFHTYTCHAHVYTCYCACMHNLDRHVSVYAYRSFRTLIQCTAKKYTD